LSAVEYRLLLTFIRNKGHLLTRQQILSDMWDSAGDFVNDNTLTVYVKRLRNKLEEDGSEPLIQTVRGIGYRMV
ncbi:MAG: winged helix-turn-helix transcriptional regulator, partial [Lachnospiraceae bacterium]|nr:winged helix-turn-helix transcriptional regulator [Lachnospiraceae bacterium]